MATIQDNVVFLKCPDIAAVEVAKRSPVVTKGQPYDRNIKVTHSGDTVAILFHCGRKKSKPVADEFAAVALNTFAPFAGGGGRPKELNFFFTVVVTFKDGKKYEVFLGQGSTGLGRNNWWIGCRELEGNNLGIYQIHGAELQDGAGQVIKKLTSNLPEPLGSIASAIGVEVFKKALGQVNVFNFYKQ